jgi:anti-sigma regulatory factor (Ser/Thr protein kinase)
MTRASRTFEPKAHEVMAARRFVTATLAAWSLEQPDAALLVSELATNAVLHARSDFTVTIDGRGDRIRIEVQDPNPRLPSPASVPAAAYSGRGLMIVQELSTAWGVESHADQGKTVWFEIKVGTNR